MAGSNRLRRRYGMASAVLVIGFLSLALLVWVNRINQRERVNTLLIDALMDAQIHGATAHLWLEQAVTGDSAVNVDRQIVAELDQAIGLVRATLNGGDSEHGPILVALRDAGLRARAKEIGAMLAKFKALGVERLRDPANKGVGSLSDQEFDALFKEILRKTSALEDAVENDRAADRKKSGQLLRWILVVWSSIVVAAAVGLWSREKRRQKAEEALWDANEQLRSLTAELTEHREHLAELVETRTAELTTANRLLRDETAERRRYEEQLEYQSNHDLLTDLPNRNLLSDRLGQAILFAHRSRQAVALLFVDIDHFKFINDSCGHHVGDRVLEAVASRLKRCVRDVDTVARYGADEFVAILSGLEKGGFAVNVARKIQEAVSRPLEIDGHELVFSCSIGISIYPRDGEDASTLLRNADAAVHRAKEQGRDNIQFYTSELNERNVVRMSMEKHLRKALEREELSVFYQPQVDFGSGRVTGAEALLRWENPVLGAVPPSRFIPLAEETGLIVPIGEWVLKTACSQNKSWQDAGFAPLTMAVNLSPRQFRQEDLAAEVRRVLRETGMDPRFLELEIIESLVMHDVEGALALLGELKGLGVQLAMDDFGTGYSSLSYLKRFPFDKLKIDLSFVRDITYDPESAAIARTIIAMAHNLKLRVIAEGVETEGQLQYLRAHGCDELQGYYFSRPLPAREFEQLLLERRQLKLPLEDAAHPERTLLLVDDEPNVIAALERVLCEDGYRIVSAVNADEGFEAMAVNPVGVVLCDHQMPGMCGIEFLGRVKELYPDTIRMVLTGHADMETVTDAVNQGSIYKFLTKPWENDMLRENVKMAFRRHEAGRSA